MNSIQTSWSPASSLPIGLDPGSRPDLAAKLKSLHQEVDDQQTEKMAGEFESVFVSLMLKEMRNTLDGEEGLFGGDQSDTFGGMFDMFMGQHLAEAKSLGIADAIEGFMKNQPSETSLNSESSSVDQTK